MRMSMVKSNTSNEVGIKRVLIAWKIIIGNSDRSQIYKHSRHQSGNR